MKIRVNRAVIIADTYSNSFYFFFITNSCENWNDEKLKYQNLIIFYNLASTKKKYIINKGNFSIIRENTEETRKPHVELLFFSVMLIIFELRFQRLII